MNNKKKQILELKTNKLVDSLFIGNYKTHFKGNGLEFADFREYNYGDDTRNIDWLSSDKTGKTLIKLYEEERELSVYFIVDADENFEFEYEGVSKKNLLEEFLYLIGLSVIKSGDRVGIFVYNQEKKDFIFAKKGRQNFSNLMNKLGEYITGEKHKPIFKNKKRNFLSFFKKKLLLSGNEKKKNSVSTFNALKIKKSLVFLLTSKTEIADIDLKILALKNDLIVCNIFHSIENDLHGKGIQGIEGKHLFIDKDNNYKREQYKILRQDKINNFKKTVRKLGGSYLKIDEKSNIYAEIFSLMKQRI